MAPSEAFYHAWYPRLRSWIIGISHFHSILCSLFFLEDGDPWAIFSISHSIACISFNCIARIILVIWHFSLVSFFFPMAVITHLFLLLHFIANISSGSVIHNFTLTFDLVLRWRGRERVRELTKIFFQASLESLNRVNNIQLQHSRHSII